MLFFHPTHSKSPYSLHVRLHARHCVSRLKLAQYNARAANISRRFLRQETSRSTALYPFEQSSGFLHIFVRVRCRLRIFLALFVSFSHTFEKHLPVVLTSVCLSVCNAASRHNTTIGWAQISQRLFRQQTSRNEGLDLYVAT